MSILTYSDTDTFNGDVKGGVVLDPSWIAFSFWMVEAENDWCLLWFTGIWLPRDTSEMACVQTGHA